MFLLRHSDMVNYSLELPPRNRLHKSKKPLSTYMYEDVHYFNRNILFTFFSFYCVFNATCFIIDFTSLLLKCLWLFCRNIYRSIRKGLVHRLKMRKTVAFPMAIVKKKKNKAITAPFSYGGRRIRVLQVFILGPAYQTGDMAHAPGLDFYLCTHNFH